MVALCQFGLSEAGANAGLSPVRKRFHQFADGLDEHLRDRAERPILQGRDADRLSNVGQFHGQCFKSGMLTRQEEREADDHREEALRREQLVAQNDGGSLYSKPRRIKTRCAKDPCIAPKSVLGRSSTQDSLSSSASSILRRRVSGLFGPVTTTKASWKRISSEYSSPTGRANREIAKSTLRAATSCRSGQARRRRHEGHPRILPREPVDDGRHDRGIDRIGRSDPHFARSRVGQKFDLLDALSHLVEDGDAALDQRPTVGRRLDAALAAIGSRTPGVSMSSPSTNRLRDRKTLGRLAHRPALDDGHQDAEVAQLEPATDPLRALLWRDHRHIAMGSSKNRVIQL